MPVAPGGVYVDDMDVLANDDEGAALLVFQDGGYWGQQLAWYRLRSVNHLEIDQALETVSIAEW